MTNKIIDKFLKDALERHSEIIDNFLKMYIASRAEWFKEKPERLRRIKLIEQRSNDGLTTTYRFEMMTGRRQTLK